MECGLCDPRKDELFFIPHDETGNAVCDLQRGKGCHTALQSTTARDPESNENQVGGKRPFLGKPCSVTFRRKPISVSTLCIILIDSEILLAKKRAGIVAGTKGVFANCIEYANGADSSMT